MTPQKIVTKLNKVERVELGLADEMKQGERLLNEIKGMNKAYDTAFQNTIRTLDRLINDLDTRGIENTTIKPAESFLKELQKAGLNDTPIHKELSFFVKAFKPSIEGIRRVERALINVTEARI
jgi:hypothetical protein